MNFYDIVNANGSRSAESRMGGGIVEAQPVAS